jgi:hypothetical protein
VNVENKHNKNLERFGFSYERGGVHTARTLMFVELRTLLSYVDAADAAKAIPKRSADDLRHYLIDFKAASATLDKRGVASLTQLLRDELNRLHADYQTRHKNGMARLDADTNWKQLEPEQRNGLLAAQKLTLADAPKVQVANADEVLETVDRLSLSSFADRVAAVDSRFDAVLVAAAELMEPDAQFVKLPNRTIKTAEDIEAWLLDAKQAIAQALKKGPVILH